MQCNSIEWWKSDALTLKNAPYLNLSSKLKISHFISWIKVYPLFLNQLAPSDSALNTDNVSRHSHGNSSFIWVWPLMLIEVVSNWNHTQTDPWGMAHNIVTSHRALCTTWYFSGPPTQWCLWAFGRGGFWVGKPCERPVFPTGQIDRAFHSNLFYLSLYPRSIHQTSVF